MDIERFLAERDEEREKFALLQKLVSKFKKKMPAVVSKWDTSPESIPFNDIDKATLSSGLSIYICKMEELWAGLYEPAVYEADTLWKKDHDSEKIAQVFDAWCKNTALSPIFLVRHLSRDQGLVADGKHRLTVSRAIHTLEIPFMVATANAEWVSRAFPSANCLHPAQTIAPS